MASRGRRDRDPGRSSGRRSRGQGDGRPSGDRDGLSGADGWVAPPPDGWSGPDDLTEVDPGPETGHWQFDPDDDLDADGTATWDGPMAWQDDQQGATWAEDGGEQGVGDVGTGHAARRLRHLARGPPTPEPLRLRELLPDRLHGPGEAPGTYTEYEAPRPEPAWTGDGGRGGRRQRRRRANGPGRSWS